MGRKLMAHAQRLCSMSRYNEGENESNLLVRTA